MHPLRDACYCAFLIVKIEKQGQKSHLVWFSSLRIRLKKNLDTIYPLNIYCTQKREQRKEVFMRRITLYLLVFVVVMACGKHGSGIHDLSQLENKTFAVPTNTLAEELILSRFPNAKFINYESIWDAAVDLKTGKIEVAAYDEPIMRSIALKNPGIRLLEENITNDEYGFAVQLTNKSLKEQIDAVFDTLKASGLYAEIDHHWFPKAGENIIMPNFSHTPKNGILKLGTAPVTEPFSYKDDKGNIIGFDIELAHYIAESLGKDLQIVEMQFGEMIPNLEKGTVDMIGACITISEERAKRVLFSNTYYKGGIAAIVRE